MFEDLLARTSLDYVRQEIHFLAYKYHTSFEELWRMTRSERKMWVYQLSKQIDAENEAIKNSSKK